MIDVKFHDKDDKYITSGMLEVVPHIGEKIWFTPIGSHPAYEVIDVCYWVSFENNNNNYQAACVFLKETI